MCKMFADFHFHLYVTYKSLTLQNVLNSFVMKIYHVFFMAKGTHENHLTVQIFPSMVYAFLHAYHASYRNYPRGNTIHS